MPPDDPPTLSGPVPTGTAVVPWVPPADPGKQGPKRDPDDILAEHLERAEKWRQAWELAQLKVPYRTIMVHIGVKSLRTVHDYIRKHERTMVPSPDVEEWRARQLAELQMLRSEVLREAKTSDTSWIAATASLLSIQKRQAELLGLDRVPPPDEFARMSDAELLAVIEAGG